MSVTERTERIDLKPTESTEDRDYAFLEGFGFSGRKEGAVKSAHKPIIAEPPKL